MKASLIFVFFNAVLIVVCIQTIFRFSFPDVGFFYAFFILMHLVMAWIAIYLIETFRENERLQLEVQKAEKLHVVGQMAASVAHEIRNPMTVVLGFIQLLHKDPDTTEKHKKHFKIMEIEMERAESIIKDYLSLAKPQSETLEKIDVAEQLDTIKQTLSHYSALNGVTMKYETHLNEDFHVYGSKEKLQQVLVNIIKNAIEVSHKGDSVYVKLLKENGMITISIKDNGPGMTSEQLAKLGTPFYSTKDKGTGLGLSVCYSIIYSMNGTIDVQSHVNKGSTFKIRLPIINEKVI
ncbi:MAG: HAMP domain-containing histidine kinase [Bacillus sp. (in: Bacteria)]|nr:HAMP domain-containing histidine kinase [Bacillus sp. (in: firmicutes)]